MWSRICGQSSATYGEWFGAELTADNGLMLYAPEDFAHGYQTLLDGTEIYYLTSAPYVASAARGIRYNDARLGIKWPLPVSIISEADQKWPDYSMFRARLTELRVWSGRASSTSGREGEERAWSA